MELLGQLSKISEETEMKGKTEGIKAMIKLIEATLKSSDNQRSSELDDLMKIAQIAMNTGE